MDVGLYGKLPSHGDFLRRRAPDDFVAVWDAWLQRCMADSRKMLGDSWLDTYLTSPAWRFSLAPGVCGAAAVAGILVPSVDRVGRYFPLTLLWPTPPHLNPLQIAYSFHSAFDAAERLLLDTLAAEHFEFADFDRHVVDLAAHGETGLAEHAQWLTPASAAALTTPMRRPRCVPLRDVSALATAAVQLMGEVLQSSGASAFWWTDGSVAIRPSWLMTPGLPEGAQFSAMLDGAWSEAGWEVGVADNDAETNLAATAVHAPAEALGVISAAHSDRGTVRTTNQDAFIERPDLRLWAVADGMGGLSDGDIASRMVCDSLANAPVVATLDEQVDEVIGQLQQVNSYLQRSATREINPIHSGSTVVVLLIRSDNFAVVWAGDSRAYRMRGGQLSQLTSDHSWDGVEGAAGEDLQAITRAVGAEETLIPDTIRGEVRAGDRFLLCSDGIYRSLDTRALQQLLRGGAPAACTKDLVTQAMARGSTDNVTALVVDCGGFRPSALTDALDIVSL